jgi:hypothetical protein
VPLPCAWLVEMTNSVSELSPSMSMNNGALGSVMRRSSGRDVDSANAIVAWNDEKRVKS